MSFHGRQHATRYHNNIKQFESVPRGGTVPVLVDPQDPEVFYTVVDVRARTNAGLGVVAVFGIAMTLAGLSGLFYFIRLWPRHDPALDGLTDAT